MTDTKLLEELIEKSGKKKVYLSKKAGMSLAWFRACSVNKGEFRESQMKVIAEELGFLNDATLFMAVFFAHCGA